MSTDIKLSNVELSKIIQSGRFLGNMIDNPGKETLINLAVSLAKDVFPKLATKAPSSITDQSERKKIGRGVVRA